MTDTWDIPTLREEYLYNPGEAFTYNYSGETFRFPAHNEHWVDPVTKQSCPEPGVMPVRPNGFEHEWNHNLKDSYGNPAYERKKHTAQEVITYFLGDNFVSGHLGKSRGIRRLSPSDRKDPVRDQQLKDEARQAYLRNRYEQAQQNIARFKAANAKAISESRPVEPANELILRDYAFVAEYNALTAQGLRFQCSECFNRFPDTAALEGHINTLHADVAGDLLKSHGLAKGKPGRKPKAVAA